MQRKLVRLLPFIAILAAALTMSDASAQVAGLDDAGTKMCAALDSIAKSKFVKAIAVVMFGIGVIMFWLKQRGAIGFAAGGLIGFFVIPKVKDIATNLGMSC